jgi:hypothetical protein
MKNAHLDEALFDKFLAMLELKGIKPRGGTLVDGTFVVVPKQHNTKNNISTAIIPMMPSFSMPIKKDKSGRIWATGILLIWMFTPLAIYFFIC